MSLAGAGGRWLAPGTGRAAALAALAARLAARDPAEARSAARILFAGVLGVSLVEVIARPDAPLDAAAVLRLEEAARRYLAGETPGRILGAREFWGMPFRLGPDTLEPRPETETLVETVLARLDRAGWRDGRPLNVVDFGAGTGCVLVALLGELPSAFGVGVDLAPGAAAVAAANARLNGVAGRCVFVAGDWDAALGPAAAGAFDVVASNPPYIESWTLHGLPPAVRLNDPGLALDGGPDGLAPYRILVPAAARLLKPGGVAAFEVGAGQAATVAAMLRGAGFADVGVREDFAGVMRVASGLRQMASGQGF
ncbi:peptide chain release factor N(5)-glutamine methyltransferase [Camelimonas abortus]|uniref:Release factor glutamine methyltransferase n=1 Tax=Camelimonas abortus TaxID=1017184 RepID=A0ABV7LCR4_9HYPH